MQTDIDRVVRFKEVTAITGFARPTIYKKIARGQFPAPFNIGDRAVGWRRSTIERWLEEREAAWIS